MAFFCSFSSGPKFSISPVNSRASAATWVGRNFEGIASRGPTPLRPEESASHSASLELPTGLIKPMPVMTTRRAEAGMMKRLAIGANGDGEAFERWP